MKLAKGTSKLWIAERRGTVVYVRGGRPSAPGVPKARPFRTEEDAQSFLDAERDKRIAEGFVMLDERAGLDAPFTGSGKPRARTIPRAYAHLADSVRMHVRGGFKTADQLDDLVEQLANDHLRSARAARNAEKRAESTLDERLRDDGIDFDDPSESRSKLHDLLRDFARDELGRLRSESAPTPCVNDAIDRAFEALNAGGVIALQAAGYTQSDGWDDVNQIAAELGRNGITPRGACFYHEQDLERGVAGRGLHLTFGSYRGEADAVELGRHIVRVLREHGVDTAWDERSGTRIHIPPFPWFRRA